MIELTGFLAAIVGQCADVVVPEATEKAMRYYHSGNYLWMIQQAWTLFVPLLFLITGISGKLGSFSEKWGKKWFFIILIYLCLFLPLFYLLNLPLDFYSGYIRQHEYGFSTQSLARWWDQYLKGISVSVVGSISFIWIFYLLLKKSPKRWWIYSAIVSIGISFFLAFVQPIWISPLFNQFGPMKDKQLEEKILKLAHRAGISNGRVFEVDKSRDTKAINAYVTGFGSTNRIVLWDTAIENLSEDELLFVMGHEMGHYVLNHILWYFIYLSFISFLTFYFIYRISNYLLFHYNKRFGFTRLDQIASIPLFLFIIPILSLFSDPLANVFSRWMEREADRFGLEITQNNTAAGKAFVVLQKENLGNPSPGMLYRIWRSSHPPLKERIEFSNHYCPWNDDQPLVYEKYFRQNDSE